MSTVQADCSIHYPTSLKLYSSVQLSLNRRPSNTLLPIDTFWPFITFTVCDSLRQTCCSILVTEPVYCTIVIGWVLAGEHKQFLLRRTHSFPSTQSSTASTYTRQTSSHTTLNPTWKPFHKLTEEQHLLGISQTSSKIKPANIEIILLVAVVLWMAIITKYSPFSRIDVASVSFPRNEAGLDSGGPSRWLDQHSEVRYMQRSAATTNNSFHDKYVSTSGLTDNAVILREGLANNCLHMISTAQLVRFNDFAPLPVGLAEQHQMKFAARFPCALVPHREGNMYVGRRIKQRRHGEPQSFVLQAGRRPVALS
jgi:hypothetical protein